MKASEAIYTRLNLLFEDRIYPLIKPESEKGVPYLVYTIMNTKPENTLDGYTGYELAYIQLDIYANDYDVCDMVTTQLLETYAEYSEPFYYEGRRYLYEDDTGLFRQSVDCHIWQSELKLFQYVGKEDVLAGDSNSLSGIDYN